MALSEAAFWDVEALLALSDAALAELAAAVALDATCVFSSSTADLSCAT